MKRNHVQELRRVRSQSTIALMLTVVFILGLPLRSSYAGSSQGLQGVRSGERPNILFIISDDQSWAHTGANGDRVVKTPVFDSVARSGVLFPNSFTSAPSCTPSRAAVLTGQAFSRLEEGANLLSTLPKKFAVYPDLLEASGYAVGFTRKGWGPGQFAPGGRTRAPAGAEFKNFDEFMKSVAEGKPLCFWFGSQDPHRPYEKGSGVASGIKLADIVVPSFLPDTPEVRSDIADYFFEIERFDREVGALLDSLKRAGKLENTIVVITSDNGMPFPRAKTNLYDYGTRMPLAIQWLAKVKGGRVITDFVSHTDFAPTFLEAAGLKAVPAMTGRSLLPMLTGRKSGRVEGWRDKAFAGRERHDVFRNNLGYPVGYPTRAVRTDKFLYIRNFEPERVPAGDNPAQNQDNDRGPTKTFIVEHKDDAHVRAFYQLAYGKRPAEELYDLTSDPQQIKNVAGSAKYRAAKKRLNADLDGWMRKMKDPRAFGKGDVFDRYPIYPGGRAAPAGATFAAPR